MWDDSDEDDEDDGISEKSSVEFIFGQETKRLTSKLDQAKEYVSSVLDDIVDKARSYSRLEFKQILAKNAPICALTQQSQTKIRMASTLTMQAFSEFQSLPRKGDFCTESTLHVAQITESIMERTQRMFVSKDLMKYLVDLRELINEIIDALKLDDSTEQIYMMNSSDDLLEKTIMPQLQTAVGVSDSLIRDCRRTCSQKNNTLEAIKKICSEICASKRKAVDVAASVDEDDIVKVEDVKVKNRPPSRTYMKQKRMRTLSDDTQNALERNFIVVKEFSKDLKNKTKRSMKRGFLLKISEKIKAQFNKLKKKRTKTDSKDMEPTEMPSNINNEIRQLNVLLRNEVLPNIQRLCRNFSMESMVHRDLSLLKNFNANNNVNVLTVHVANADDNLFPFEREIDRVETGIDL